jgi:hypothetical protein
MTEAERREVQINNQVTNLATRIEALEKRLHDVDHMLERFCPNIASRVTELEAKEPNVAKGDGKLVTELVPAPVWASWHENVEALVKAATEYCDEAPWSEHAYQKELRAALRAALKPFEK